MPLEERRSRHKKLYAAICEYGVERWQREFLTALRQGRDGFESYTSNRELTNLAASGPGWAMSPLAADAA
jgi:trehalose-6-phosphate synthase